MLVVAMDPLNQSAWEYSPWALPSDSGSLWTINPWLPRFIYYLFLHITGDGHEQVCWARAETAGENYTGELIFACVRQLAW